jgi:hypothetical protein
MYDDIQYVRYELPTGEVIRAFSNTLQSKPLPFTCQQQTAELKRLKEGFRFLMQSQRQSED